MAASAFCKFLKNGIYKSLVYHASGFYTNLCILYKQILKSKTNYGLSYLNSKSLAYCHYIYIYIYNIYM